MNRWWVDEPAVIGCASPSDADLNAWRAEGFSVLVCLLDLEDQEAILREFEKSVRNNRR